MVDAVPIPESEWVWCGYPGHFIGSRDCLMHLHTRVGDYRISTVGDYRPAMVYDSGELRARVPQDEAEQIGAGRKFETFVLRVIGHGEHGEGEVTDWSEIWTDAYNENVAAEQGHMEVCRRFARVAAGLDAEPSWESA